MRRSNQSKMATCSCVTTLFLWTTLLALCAHAYPATPTTNDLRLRQHDHEHGHHEAAHELEGDTAGMDMIDSVAEMPAPSHLSAVVTPTPSSGHHNPPDPHGGHSHGSHAAPKDILDDVDIHFWHKFPPSYLAADFRLDNDTAIFGEDFDEEWDPETAYAHKGLVIAHAVGFYMAYFAVLPLALALRAAEHPSHHLVNLGSLVLATLGWLAGAAYKTATPDRYEGSIYSRLVCILLFSSYILAIFDSFHLIQRAINLRRSQNASWKEIGHMLTRQSVDLPNRYEMVGLVEGEDGNEIRDEPEQHVVFALGEDEEDEDVPSRTLSRSSHHPRRPSLLRHWSPPSRHSTGSDGTLHESPVGELPTEGTPKHYQGRAGAYDVHDDTAGETSSAWRRPQAIEPRNRFIMIGQTALTWIRRFQVVFAYITLIAGFATYTGMCRGSYVNSCVAHYVKGSIFFGYGLLTFARYLGAYADLGWAWNRKPSARAGPTAEMVECAVIFTYGITNTWLERLGAAPGSPYNVKQVQHISIAIMFWFAGLSGMLLESKTIRRILGSAKTTTGEAEEPPSYVFSFNPLPALVIAVTGLAMAAHHQNYVFQVEIHKLWGVLLAGGSAFRFLTYFFLYIRPPTESTLPGRPPTEMLTAFGWAAGGIVFMLSNEEICFAAMRAGYDDMMAFLNFTIALTSLVFCWTVVVMAVKGWGVMRLQREQGGLSRA